MTDPLLLATLEILRDRAHRHRARRERALAAGAYAAVKATESAQEPRTAADGWTDAFADVLRLEAASGELTSAEQLRARFDELREHYLALDDAEAEDAAALFAVTWPQVLARLGGGLA